MAFGLKHWIGLVFLLLVGVGAWGIAPPYDPFPRERVQLPEREHSLELQHELLKEEWLYRRLQWRDSMVSELRAGVSTGQRVVIGLPEEATDSLRERLEMAVDLQLADLGSSALAMPVGVFLLPQAQGSYDGATTRTLPVETGREYYVGRGGEALYCIVARSYYEPTDTLRVRDGRTRAPLEYAARFLARISTNPRAHPNTFGLCRYFAGHGQPGPGIMTWLRAGASHFGSAPYDVDHHLMLGRGPARGAMGKTSREFGPLAPRTLHCLDGNEEDCEGMLLDFDTRPISWNGRTLDVPSLLAESPVDFLQNFPRIQQELPGLDPFLFFALEEEFGPDRFGAFWRSPLEPAEAFEDAFGEPMGQWVMRWLRAHMDPSPRGPGVPIQATFYTLLALGLLAGGAVRIGRR